jgi:mono/diheme cytochrome c family protein
MQQTIWLGVLMAAIAVVNASLMAWLWRFPMQPDPTGRDPNGVSTAPRFPTNVHRVLGYVFVLASAALLFEMVPRTWEFRVATPTSVLHGALGVAVGVLLVIKIAVIRRFRRFGNRLPWIGGALAVTTLVVALLGIVPAWKVLRQLAQGREVVSRKCNQCHGASTIASEREDARKWARITREMQRFSRTIPGKEPITEEERLLATAYLAHTLGEAGDEDDEDELEDAEEEDAREERDDGRRRGRGRGRG